MDSTPPSSLMLYEADGVMKAFTVKPGVGSMQSVGSPASRHRSVVFPAPLRPRHSMENSGLLGGGGGQQQGHTYLVHCIGVRGGGY